MKTAKYSAYSLKTLLLKYKMATMEELKNCLNTNINMTVLRKLKELTYITSYSHSGKYYTLQAIAKFNNDGLWSFNDVHFSKYDTLVNTIEEFVNQSSHGYSRNELEDILHVKVQEQLHQLFKIKKIHREKIDPYYVYFSSDSNVYRKQRLLRQEKIESITRGVATDCCKNSWSSCIISVSSPNSGETGECSETNPLLFNGLENGREDFPSNLEKTPLNVRK